MRSRVTPLRNRRDVGAKRMQSVAHSRTERDTSDTTTNDETVILPTNISTADLAKKQNGTDAENQRSKRETPECVINYNSPRQLLVGCSQSNVVEVKPHCSDDGDEGNLVDSFQWYFSCVPSAHVCFSHFIPVYNCQGSWTDNNKTTFIVATHAGSQHAVCITYQTIDDTNVRLFVGDSCYRSSALPIYDHHLAANLTIFGKPKALSQSRGQIHGK